MAGPATSALYVAGGLVREIWPDESLIEEVITEDPILGLCKKDSSWGNGVHHHPLGYGGNQGIGRSFATAKRTKSRAKQAEFQLSTREMFAALSLDGKLLRTFEYNKKRELLVDPIKREGERAIDLMRARFSKAIHGNGIGIIGRMTAASTVSSATITLRDANDLKNFQPGTVVQCIDVATTGGTLRSAGAEAEVASVGTYESPTVTFTAALNSTIGAVAASDYFVFTGTYDDDFFYGLDAFLPSHTGSPGTFLTCTRNDNPEWFAGMCLTGTGMATTQRIWKAARYLADRGEKPDTYLMSSRNYERFIFEMENKLRLEKLPAAPIGKVSLGVEYDAAVIAGPRGPIKVICSSWMPDSVERCGRLDTLTMGSIGPLVHWDMGNGPSDLRTEDGTDNRELRAVSDPAFLVERPGAWCRVTV